MLVFLGAGGIDHAGNMARAGQRKGDVAPIIAGPAIDRLPWTDMVGAAGLNKDRRGDVGHGDGRSEHFERPTRQFIPVIELFQIGLVGGPGNVRLISIPVKQVEGLWRFAQHVVVDDIAPDQIGRAKPVEGFPHHAARHQAIIVFNDGIEIVAPFLGCEDFELARFLKVRLRGEQGGRMNPLVRFLGHVGHGRGQQSPADAVANRVDVGRTGFLGHKVQSGQGALFHIVVPFEIPGFDICRAPGHNKCVDPFGQQPSDHRIFGLQIENVELVDPGREDEHGPLPHFPAGRGIVNDLDQAVAINHFTFGGGHILAHPEGGFIGLGHRQTAITPLEILAQVAQTVAQAAPAGFQHGPHRSRIGRHEIGWGHHIDPLTDEEFGLSMGFGVQIIRGRIDQPAKPVGIQCPGAANEVEGGIGGPLGIRKPAVLGQGRSARHGLEQRHPALAKCHHGVADLFRMPGNGTAQLHLSVQSTKRVMAVGRGEGGPERHHRLCHQRLSLLRRPEQVLGQTLKFFRVHAGKCRRQGHVAHGAIFIILGHVTSVSPI